MAKYQLGVSGVSPHDGPWDAARDARSAGPHPLLLEAQNLCLALGALALCRRRGVVRNRDHRRVVDCRGWTSTVDCLATPENAGCRFGIDFHGGSRILAGVFHHSVL